MEWEKKQCVWCVCVCVCVCVCACVCVCVCVSQDLPTSLPMLLCRIATSMACSIANLSESRAGDTHALRRTSVRHEFISATNDGRMSE